MIQIVRAFHWTPIPSLSKRTLYQPPQMPTPWPSLTRPSTPLIFRENKTWVLGSSPGTGGQDFWRLVLALALSGSLVLANTPAYAIPTTSNTSAVSSPSEPQQTSAQLQQVVAPIALYPDPLVAQILAASTYPAEVVEADRWLKQHPGLTGQQLADEVEKQSWDPSVKALTEFPSVLANMNKNLSWTSALGEAYVNQSQDVMDAVQEMRRRAQNAGHLQSTPQQNVTTQGQTIEILPTSPDVVYVSEYDPWLVYGPATAAWPGWSPYPGLYVTTPGIVFGLGIGVGLFSGFAWGWHNWGFDWAHRTVVFNHNNYISHSTPFINRRAVMDRHAFINHHGSAGGFHSGGFHGARVAGFHGGGFHGGRYAGFHGGGFHGARVAGFHGGGFHGGFHGGGAHGGGRR